MKAYECGRIRNVALIGHSGTGKTSLTEATLFTSGAISRFGKVEEGSTTTDYDPEEAKRHISISTALAPCEWKDHKINLLDTPGFFDFVGEVHSALQVADGVILVVSSASGVEVGTEKTWDYARERSLPIVIAINKMDRENANFTQTLEALRTQFGSQIVPVVIPMGAAENFRGIIDLVKMKAYAGEGSRAKEEDIPPEFADEVGRYRDMLMENVAMVDDDLLNKYLNGEPLSDSEMESALKKGVKEGKIVPVLSLSSLKMAGMVQFLDTILLLPAPNEREIPEATLVKGSTGKLACDPAAPPVAFVFKTMADPYVGKLTMFKVYSGTLRSDSILYNPSKDKEERIGQLFVVKGKEQMPMPQIGPGDLGAVAKLQETQTGDTLCDKAHALTLPRIAFPSPVIALAIIPHSKGDEDKISGALARLVEEDPTLKIEKHSETAQMLLSGLGEMHLEVVVSKLKKKFGIDVDLEPPEVPYRETVRGSVKVEGKHKKQTGGRGQYGHVWLELEPLPPGQGFQFVDKIFGGAVPRQYIPAVEKGLRECMAVGVLAGYPVVDVKVSLVDGSYHPVDSSEMAFKVASSMAFKKGFMDAKAVLLEPIVKAEITVPESNMGDIMGDLNKRRGKILGMEPQGKQEVIRALAPMSEMFKYAVDLRSMTQGRGEFHMEFDHYEEIPALQSQQIIDQAKKERRHEAEV